MDLPQTLRYTYTQILIVIGDILIHEPHEHIYIGESPSWVGHLVVRVKVDYIGFMSLSSYHSLPMESPLQGMDPTHNLHYYVV